MPELVEGFARLARRRPDVHLAIVGDARGVPPVDVGARVRAAGMEQRVTVRGYVTDTELAELYGRASAFAFLSSYEGFGLTPLDAIAAGIPAVVLDTPVAREIYGDGRSPCACSRSRLSSRPRSNRCSSIPLSARGWPQAGRDIASRYAWSASGADTLAALVRAGR